MVGVASDGTAQDYFEMLRTIGRSKTTTEQFIASQNQRHQDTMALIEQRRREMTARHEANMQWIQDSANAHQQRMDAIWSANDANVAGFYERMQSGDVQQRQFLNYINEENTVQNTSGQKFQVDDGYDRYWMNTVDNTYVGGDINFGESQLLEMGLEPGNYEEVQVIKG